MGVSIDFCVCVGAGVGVGVCNLLVVVLSLLVVFTILIIACYYFVAIVIVITHFSRFTSQNEIDMQKPVSSFKSVEGAGLLDWLVCARWL